MPSLQTLTESLLTAHDVSYGVRGHQLVSGVSLSLIPGRCLGIVGPNGAGKTTLLRLLTGFLSPTAGSVELGGARVDKLRPDQLARQLAFVPQVTRHDLEFTVFEVALLGRYVHSPGWREGEADHAIVREALAHAGVAHLADRPFRTLSGGEQQRVILARALAQQPRLLLLDEPTASLDPRYQLAVLETVRRFVVDKELAAVAVLHDLTLAARYCDDLLLLHQGRVAAAGSSEDVLQPDLLRDVYGVTVSVEPHPRLGHLVVLPEALAPVGGAP